MRAKKVLSLVLTLSLLACSVSVVFASNSGYSDVPRSHWSYDVVEKWSSDRYGIIDGNETGKFNPNDSLTLAALATILSKTFGYAEQDTGVSVIPVWAKGYIQKAVAAGVIPKAETIDANALLTREQVIKYLAVAYGISPAKGDAAFRDKSGITASNMGYIKAFQDKGYIEGSSSDPKKSMLNPAKYCTRAEVIKIMDNMVSDIVESDTDGRTYEKSLILRKGANLANTTVKGDLIIAQGVGNGHVELNNVIVKGRLIAYGGGENTIVIKGNSQIPSVIAIKAYGEPVRIKVQDGATVSEVVIAPFTAAVVNGIVADLVVDGDAKVTLQDAAVESIVVTDRGANVVVGSGSTVENLNVDGAATIKVDDGAKVVTATVTAGDVEIVGKGKLDNVEVTKDANTGVRVDTANTTIQNNSTFAVTNSEGKSVAPGESNVIAQTPAPPPASDPTPPPASDPTPPPITPTHSASVATEADFTAAVANTGITNIAVTSDIAVAGNVTLRSGVTLTVNSGAKLTVNGLLTGADYTVKLIINNTGLIKATEINDIGEGTYNQMFNGKWSKQFSSDEIKSKFTGTGDFIIPVTTFTGTSPRVYDVILGYGIESTRGAPVTVTLAASYTIPDGKDLRIGDDVTLVIPGGKTLTVDGVLRSSGIKNNGSIKVEAGGTVHLAQPSAVLSEGTYVYVGGLWGQRAVVSNETALAAAVASTDINSIWVNGNITVDGDVILRNGVTATVKSGSALTINGQLKTSTAAGTSARLEIENGGTFCATGLTNLAAGAYSGWGDYWYSEIWKAQMRDAWLDILHNKFGLTQDNSWSVSYKTPPAGVYLNDGISKFLLEGYDVTLSESCTIPENGGLGLRNSTLTIPDGVTLTVGNNGIQGEAPLSKIILQGKGNITGTTILSGAGTYVYARGQWLPEIPMEVNTASELTNALNSTTPAGAVFHVKQSIADIGAYITIPEGVSVVIDAGVEVSTTKNINVSSGDLCINGTLTIGNGGVLISNTRISVGRTGTLTRTEAGSFGLNTNVFVLTGGRLGSISPSVYGGRYFYWDGTAWK